MKNSLKDPVPAAASTKTLSDIKAFLFDRYRFAFDNFYEEDESHEYEACRFVINGKYVVFRSSKITPKKVGQFVTVWKRDQNAITQPFDASDPIDFIMISCRDGLNFGLFIFPKSVLLEKGIISSPKKEGKRGTRVYPPWDQVTNEQARKTQHWQTKFFIPIQHDSPTNLDLFKDLVKLD